MIVNKPNPEFYFLASPLNVSRVRSFTCHHHRLVSSPERAVSTWQLTFMRHSSDAETGSRQTTRVCAHWDGGEESTTVFRDAGRARRRRDRGGEGGEGRQHTYEYSWRVGNVVRRISTNQGVNMTLAQKPTVREIN